GAAFLWFGWFGFNAGSAGSAGTLAVTAFINTNTAAAAAGVSWMLLDWCYNKVPTMLGVATGLVAGLVAVTPAAGFVTPVSALAIGAISSVVCFIFVTKVKPFFGYDDSLDVFGVHGVGGIVGALATGVFATKAVNPAGADGLLYGNPGQLWVQFIATIAAIAFSAIGTAVLYKFVDLVIGMRVDTRDEYIGLDLTQHRETGYTVIE
ncbi:MAG TPA: ammonia channel protein, partial [Spirochaetota bacterium]|nr:ammonia channel protein [Spirochaetota bacterium]